MVTSAKKSTFYLTREQLIREIIASKKRFRESNMPRTPAECFTPNLTNYLQLMVNRYANKGQWRGYSYIDDMKSEALLTLCQNAFKYDETRYDNPFGYYTQIIKYCFITCLEKEEIVRDIKDSLWESIGMTPSYARQIKNEMLREIGDTSNKGMKTIKRDAEAISEKINAVGALGQRVNKLREPDMDLDFEISETLEIDPLPYTGDEQAALQLFIQAPVYLIEKDIEIAGTRVHCLTLQDSSTRSNTKRVIPDTSDASVTLALCSVGLTVRRDLLVKRLREISGYNLAPRYPTPAEANDNTVGFADTPDLVPTDTTGKRRRRKVVTS